MSADFDKDAAVAEIRAWASPYLEIMTTQASRTLLCGLLYDAIHSGKLGLKDAVAGALEGDPYLDRALRALTQDCLADKFLPLDLFPFMQAIVAAEGPANFPKGRHAYNSLNRNMMVRVLVGLTKSRWAVAKTRSDATVREKPCACSLVADALKLSGVYLTEERVVEIVGAG